MTCEATPQPSTAAEAASTTSLAAAAMREAEDAVAQAIRQMSDTLRKPPAREAPVDSPS